MFRSLRSALETLRVNPLMVAIATLGNLTCLGLLLGYLNLRSTSFISASSVLLVSLSAALRLTGGVLTSHEPRPRSNTALIVPLLFLLAGCRWLFRPSDVRLSWLFRTWDGITNPGLVTYSKITGNIGSDISTLTQWETYPRAPHFALGQLSRVAEGLGYGNTSHRLTIYAVGLWFTYSLVILGIGTVIKRAGDALKLNNRRTSVVAILAQLSVVVSGFLDKTLLLHSLSFLACIAVCLSLIALWVDHVNDVELKWQQVLLGALHLVVIVETFPLIYVFVTVYFGLFFRRFVASESFKDPLAVASLVVPFAIIGPRLLQQMRVATASNHVEAGGICLASRQRFLLGPVWRSSSALSP